MEQITINFEASPVESFETAREYIATLTHQQSKQQKVIAADMDYSPSDLTRKLAQSPNDSRRFTLDDLEKWLQVTNDFRPLFYLMQKYVVSAKTTAQLQKELESLQQQLEKKA